MSGLLLFHLQQALHEALAAAPMVLGTCGCCGLLRLLLGTVLLLSLSNGPHLLGTGQGERIGEAFSQPDCPTKSLCAPTLQGTLTLPLPLWGPGGCSQILQVPHQAPTPGAPLRLTWALPPPGSLSCGPTIRSFPLLQSARPVVVWPEVSFLRAGTSSAFILVYPALLST